MMEVEVDTKIDIPVSSQPAIENVEQTANVMDHEGSEVKLFATPNVCSNNYREKSWCIYNNFAAWSFKLVNAV